MITKAKINAAILWIKSLFSKGSGKISDGKVVVEKPRPSKDEIKLGAKLVEIPFAHQVKNGMGYKGTYSGGYPKGAIVHYTAGRFKGGVNKAIDTMNGGKKNGYTFLVISYDGEVVQGFPIDKWGWHAGQSSHKSFSGSASDKLIGIEICNAGLLTKRGDKFFSWYGEEIPSDQVRQVKGTTDNQRAGYYHKYSKEQEDALVNLLLWLKANNPSGFNFDLVLGHDEVSPGRKQDPGGSLSMSMPKFREHLISEWMNYTQTPRDLS